MNIKPLENYKYRCEFIIEILVNREQEYIRRKKDKDIGFDDYSSDFEDTDFQDAKRWIRDTKISFYSNTPEEIKQQINFIFHNASINIIPLIENGYYYWFDNNCLIEQQRVLHKGKLYVEYACDVKISDKDLIELVEEKI